MFVPFRDKARAQHACEHMMPHLARRALLEPLGLYSLAEVHSYLIIVNSEGAHSRNNRQACEKGVSFGSTMSLTELPPLPYDYSALEPYVDATTMQIHHDKHHATCVPSVSRIGNITS